MQCTVYVLCGTVECDVIEMTFKLFIFSNVSMYLSTSGGSAGGVKNRNLKQFAVHSHDKNVVVA